MSALAGRISGARQITDTVDVHGASAEPPDAVDTVEGVAVATGENDLQRQVGSRLGDRSSSRAWHRGPSRPWRCRRTRGGQERHRDEATPAQAPGAVGSAEEVVTDVRRCAGAGRSEAQAAG